MNDLAVKDPALKTLTLIEPLTVAPGVVIPAGTVLRGRLEYLNDVLDNNPTPLNKATLLSDETARIIGLSGEKATVNNAIAEIFRRRGGTWNEFVADPFDLDVENALLGGLI